MVVVVVVEVVVVDVVDVDVVVDSLCGAATVGVESSRLNTTAPADAPPITKTSPAPTNALRVMKRMDPSESCDLVLGGIGVSARHLERNRGREPPRGTVPRKAQKASATESVRN